MASREDPKEAVLPPLSKNSMHRTSSKMGLAGLQLVKYLVGTLDTVEAMQSSMMQ